MKHLIKTAIAIAASLLILVSCNEKEEVPPQPDFILVNLEEPYTVAAGVSFEMSVPEEGKVTSYEWKLPDNLVIVKGDKDAKITVYAEAEGTIEVGSISVTAINTTGKSYARTLYKAIKIVKAPSKIQLSVYVPEIEGTVTVDKDVEFNIFVPEDPSVATYQWTLPAALEVIDGAGTDRLTVKTSVNNVAIPGNSISIKMVGQNGVEDTHYFERPIYVLPLDDYKTRRYGDKVWMIENLRYTGEDGTLGRVYGDNTNEDFIRLHGRLYTWHEAMSGKPGATSDDHGLIWGATGTDDAGNEYTLNNTIASHNLQIRGACPEGWHVANAYDRYDLIKAIATEFNALYGSAADAMANNGIYMYHNKVTDDGPVTSMTLTTYGTVGAYLRGGRPDTEGGIWSTNNANILEGGKVFRYNNVDYQMYYSRVGEVGFNILPSGQYTAGAYKAFGQWCYYWTATIRNDGYNMRLTLAYNNLNFSNGWETSENANTVRCVANY